MLKRVEIKNFRSCHDVVLDDLGPMIALVGRNAVGKTNILQAIQWAAQAATAGNITYDQFDKPSVALTIALNGATYRYQLSARLSHLDAKIAVIEESLEQCEGDGQSRKIFDRDGENIVLFTPTPTPITVGPLVSCISAIDSLFPASSPIATAVKPFRDAIELIRYYPLEITAEHASGDNHGLIHQSEYDSWLNNYRGTGKPGPSAQLRLLHLVLTNDSRFQEICELLGPDGLGVVLSITKSDYSSRALKDESMFYGFGYQTSPGHSRFYFPALSAGTQRTICLIVSLIFDQSSVMLIEHPEDSIHRGLLRKVISILRTYSDQSQVILSSHSSVVFNTLDPTAIRLVTMEDGATKVRPLTSNELSAAGKFMEEEGTLSEFIETVEEE